MLEGLSVDMPLKTQLWCKGAKTATHLNGQLIRPGSKRSAFDKFYQGKTKTIVDAPRFFGEVVMVTICHKIKAKLANQAKPCLWLGYVED